MMNTQQYPITIAETPSFQRSVKKLLTDEDLSQLIGHVAFHPTEGDVIPDTGGIRKMRFRHGDQGKRGGIRVLYLFYDLNMPLYLLMAYPKSQKIDISDEEKKEMKSLAVALVKAQHKGKEIRHVSGQ